jgi:hypothetical protein
MQIPGSFIAYGLAFLLTTSTAFAQGTTDRPLSYDYVFSSLALTELDAGGLEIGGSFSLAPNVHAFASYQDWELNQNVDRSILQVGVSYHWDLSANLDLVASVAFADSELDFPGPSKIDDDGLILGFGLRHWLSDSVEAYADILLDDSLGRNVDSVLRLGGEYHINPQFSIGGRVRVDEDETTLFLGGRFYFGRN